MKKNLSKLWNDVFRNRIARKSFFTSFEDWRIRTRMKIFLLEDELSQQIRVEKHIAEIAKELEIKLEVISTGKISEFENYIQHSDIHQLYFLDIHIQDNEYCGLEIAQKIREANPYAIIVFITTKSEFASITYQRLFKLEMMI